MPRFTPVLTVVMIVFLVACGGDENNGQPATNPPSDPLSVQEADRNETELAVDANVAEITIDQLTKLEHRLEEIRQLLKIPGLAAGVVMDQGLIWARGFGYADVENGIPVTADTPFHLASVTKPIAATVILGLVEEGVISLDDPVANYGVQLDSQGQILVRHLLTHTSQGVPGQKFSYSGDRYGYLGQVTQVATGQSFRELIGQRLLEPLNMIHSAPNYGDCGPDGEFAWLADEGWGAGFAEVYQAMARPYMLDQAYQLADGSYSTTFNPAAGLVASVTDLAAFDIALDQDRLLKSETKAMMLEPVISTMGESQEHQYALGWYIQEYEGTRLEWHTGRWQPSVSALYLKVPELDITFFALANSTNLTTPYPAGVGEVMYSTPALAFYRYLVFPQLYEDLPLPELDWSRPAGQLVEELGAVENATVRRFLARELWSYRMAYYSVGLREDVERLALIRRDAFPDVGPMNNFLGSAADIPVVRSQVTLSSEEKAAYAGLYELVDAPILPAGADVPIQANILDNGESLVACGPDMSPLFLYPVEDNRFFASGGPGSAIYFDFGKDSAGHDQISVWMTEELALVYRRDDG